MIFLLKLLVEQNFIHSAIYWTQILLLLRQFQTEEICGIKIYIICNHEGVLGTKQCVEQIQIEI